ncbi:MAG: translation initiation factor IF-2 N-terminal domain-containing protein, partial [Candidatus Binatia bacterium]
MSKKMVSELAKDLNVEVKDVLGYLEKLGKKRTTVRTLLTDDEQEKVRALQIEATRPEVRIGEERVKVTETGTETDTRVSANVIKRRKVASSPTVDEPPPLPASFEGDGDDGSLPPPSAE